MRFNVECSILDYLYLLQINPVCFILQSFFKHHFFNYLAVQTNYNLAESSLKNSQDNMRISETKKRLGQISDNDHSRIELSVLNAQKG